MPRMSKKLKDEWGFFIGSNGRRQYNRLCLRCSRECKQSFRVTVASCPKYISKRSKRIN